MTHDSGVAVVAKAAAILAAFSPLVSTLSVRQIAVRTGIPRSTTHDLCTSLCRAGLLEQEPLGGYRLGPALVSLGGQVIDRTGLVSAAEGLLGRLASRGGLEVHLGQLVAGWIVYLDRAAGAVPPAMRNRVGLRAPAHLTGCGKAALSAVPPSELPALVQDACRAEGIEVPDLHRLQGELAAVQRRGFVVSATFQRGRTSVAAPILDARGVPVGGLSVAGPTELFTTELVSRLADRVRETANGVSLRLVTRPGSVYASRSGSLTAT